MDGNKSQALFIYRNDKSSMQWIHNLIIMISTTLQPFTFAIRYIDTYIKNPNVGLDP